MAVDLKQQLNQMAAKADLIIGRFRQMSEQKQAAESRIAQLESELAAARKQIRQLEVDNEYLRVASTLGRDRAEIEKTRSFISGLVREIDRCILDLKE